MAERKQTNKAGDFGENMVDLLLNGTNVKHKWQRINFGRGRKWQPDFNIWLPSNNTDTPDAFIEVKVQFETGTSDAKIAGQMIKAYRMGLKGWFVLISHKHRESFSHSTIDDLRWLCDTVFDGKIKLAVGLEDLENQLRASGYVRN